MRLWRYSSWSTGEMGQIFCLVDKSRNIEFLRQLGEGQLGNCNRLEGS
jgi:hypothetical protein